MAKNFVDFTRPPLLSSDDPNWKSDCSLRREFFFIFQPSSTRGCMFQRFFESHGGKFQRFFDFHGGKILELKKSYGYKKKIRPPKAAEKIWPFFFVQNQDFSGEIHFFLTSQEVKFLTFQKFMDVRFGPFPNLVGVSFREN